MSEGNPLIFFPRLAFSFYSTETFQLVSSLIGTAVLGFGLYNLILTLWSWIKPSNILFYSHSETGSWALVTGASDGIGYGFSDELLNTGFNVLLHGRNEAKLNRCRKELAEKYPRRKVEIVVADASRQDQSYKLVAEKVANLPGKLTVLVNNVGGVPTTPQYVAHSEVSHEDIDTILNINIRFTAHVTRDLLPMLKANGPTLILNCGSAAAILGSPYICTYAGTKAFIHEFTRSLKIELAGEGVKDVEVLGLLIGNVLSGNNKYSMTGTISSLDCAKGALGRVGCGQTLTYTNPWQALQIWSAATFLPKKRMGDILIKELRMRRDDQKKEA